MSYSSHEPSISDLLIAFLSSSRSSYQFHKILNERSVARYKKESIHTSLYRLKNTGHVANRNGYWSATEKGRDRKLYKDADLLSYIPSPFNTDADPVNIVAFDIPEKDRRKRNWLRNQLKIFGYKMLQQSLWLGPGPLPQDFLKRLVILKLRDRVKIFATKSKKS